MALVDPAEQFDAGDIQRFREIETLPGPAAEFAQALQLLGPFDALGNYANFEVCRHTEDGPHELVLGGSEADGTDASVRSRHQERSEGSAGDGEPDMNASGCDALYSEKMDSKRLKNRPPIH